MRKIKSLLLHAVELTGGTPRPSGVQRLAIPHTFEEGLAFPEAAIAIGGAFVRILLGSLLFAFWGTLVWWSWSAIPNLVLRCAVAVVLVAAFFGLLLALMIVISTIARAVTPRRT